MFQAISIAIIIVLTAIDRLTKYIAVNTVKIDGPKEFLFGLFQFRYVENTGAAFSSFSDNTVALTVITVIILFFCIAWLLSKKHKPLFLDISPEDLSIHYQMVSSHKISHKQLRQLSSNHMTLNILCLS